MRGSPAAATGLKPSSVLGTKRPMPELDWARLSVVQAADAVKSKPIRSMLRSGSCLVLFCLQLSGMDVP